MDTLCSSSAGMSGLASVPGLAQQSALQLAPQLAPKSARESVPALELELDPQLAQESVPVLSALESVPKLALASAQPSAWE